MIIVCGDSLIDFLPGRMEGGGDGYRAAPGGSCRNIASGLGRLGAAVGFMGGLSTDFFGDMIAASLAEDGVELGYAPRLPEPSTLAFVELGATEPAYAFLDEPSAHRAWRLSASPPLAATVAALHVGSLSLIPHGLGDEILTLMRANKGRRVLSIDPNCRPSLTRDLDGYRVRLAAMFGLADIIKLSEADFEFLHPGEEIARAARGWIDAGTSLVILTRGGEGATAWTRAGEVSVAAPAVEVADTVGAGDSFIAASLFELDRQRLLHVGALDGIGVAQAQRALQLAVEVAAITCSRLGADPPRLAELRPGGWRSG